MAKFALSALISTLGLFSCWSSSAFALPLQPNIRLTTEPPIEQVRPAEKPVLLTLQAVDEQGKQINNAKMRLQIITPPKTPWFSSDFPIVEGTKLLDLEAIAPNGKLQLQQVLPIRGNYQLIVDVTPLSNQQFTATQQTLTLSVPENPVKYRNFVILAVILLGVGFAGGWVIGERQPTQAGEIAPQRVRLLLSGAILVAIATLLIVNITAELADSHEGEDHSQDQGPGATIIVPQPLDVKWLGDRQAKVGQLSQMAIQVNDPQTGQPVKDVVVKVKATQTEHHETVFVYQGIPNATGKLLWQQQFFDGAPHKIEIEVFPQTGAIPQFSPFQVSREIEVEGVAPPLHTRLISLAYFTGILVLGLLLGLKLRQSRLHFER